MALIPKLKNTIGRNYGVEADDTLTMKNVLKRLGCIAPGSLDTSLSHAAGLSDIAVCHA